MTLPMSNESVLFLKLAVFQISNTGGSWSTLPHCDTAWCHAWPSMTPSTTTALVAMCVRDAKRTMFFAFVHANPTLQVAAIFGDTDWHRPTSRCDHSTLTLRLCGIPVMLVHRATQPSLVDRENLNPVTGACDYRRVTLRLCDTTVVLMHRATQPSLVGRQELNPVTGAYDHSSLTRRP